MTGNRGKRFLQRRLRKQGHDFGSVFLNMENMGMVCQEYLTGHSFFCQHSGEKVNLWKVLFRRGGKTGQLSIREEGKQGKHIKIHSYQEEVYL